MGSDVRDVLIVGAGPTGLALAAQLAAGGVRARVVDRSLDRVHESRALAIQPRTLEVLAGLGVTEQLVEHGNRGTVMRVHARGRVRTMPLFDLGLADTAYPYLLFLSQAETERILAEHLAAAGLTVERGVELVDLSQDTAAAAATLRHRDGGDEVVRARYVVGCDGAHSAVRSRSGIPFEGGTYPQTFVLADTEADGVEPGAAHVFLSGRGLLFFFFPLSHPATWRVVIMRPPTDPTPADAPVTLAEVQALTDPYTGGTVRLRDPVWLTNFRLHHRAVPHYRAGRVFLAGDAAHIHSPAGAQGMNTGIQDAANLGWKLAHTLRGLAGPALLDTYHVERAPIGRTVLRFTDRAFTVATATNPVVRFARTRVAPVVLSLAGRSRSGRALGFRTLSQLGISYRRSPLAVGGPGAPRRGVRAGDRLPDGPVIHDGQSSTLHRVTAAATWHLLLCGPPGRWADPSVTALGERYTGLLTVHHLTTQDLPGALRDQHGRVSRRLGIAAADPAHYLVRPDGHIGYLAAGTDLRGLSGYLRRWLPGVGA